VPANDCVPTVAQAYAVSDESAADESAQVLVVDHVD